MKLTGYLAILLLLASCDYTTTGEICNHKGADIEVVISPFDNSDYSILKNDQLTLTRWDTLEQKGYFQLKSDVCAPVAMGINSFAPQELMFNYIEIRSLTDTLIINNQKEIHQRFKETKRYHYKWIIE